LLQALALEQIDEIDEPVVLDHFETYVFSQDDRLGIATPIGQRSWFTYATEPAPHRRAGPRAARRRGVRGPLPRIASGSVVDSTLKTLDLLASKAPHGLSLVSDEHPAYRIAVARHPARDSIEHRTYANPPRGPGTDRTRARLRDREMFAVDLFHKLWRHTQSHHKRKSIAFGRRSNAVLERAALMADGLLAQLRQGRFRAKARSDHTRDASGYRVTSVDMARRPCPAVVSGTYRTARGVDADLSPGVDYPGGGAQHPARAAARFLARESNGDLPRPTNSSARSQVQQAAHHVEDCQDAGQRD
jgi:hypothetical protein